MSALSDALAGGGAWIKWDDVGRGTVVAGTITGTEVRQATKYQTSEPDFWDDGKPKMQALVHLATAMRDPRDPDDDGARTLSINLWSGQRKALAAACRAAGVDEPLPGQQLTAVWTTGLGTAKEPRQFAYTLGPAPTGLAGALADQAPAQPPAAAAPQAAQPATWTVGAGHTDPPQPAAPPQSVPAAQDPGATVATARQLLATGMPHAQIAAATGLGLDVVAALANLPAL